MNKAIPSKPVAEIRLASEQTLAELTETTPKFWQNDRLQHKGKHPGCPYIKSGRMVRYELSTALEWFKKRGAASTQHDSSSGVEF